MSSLLSIQDLHISIGGTEIIHGIDLEIYERELHVLMGPNGSGKSTLVSTLMGHPGYDVSRGSVIFRGNDLLSMHPYERAHAGLFLAFQYPREITGVTLRSFLFAAQKSCRGSDAFVSPMKFKKFLKEKMDLLAIDSSFAERSLNHGFSGGEKKKAEILQMHILQPALALLDEVDSGLDIDALKVVAEGINVLRNKSFDRIQDSKINMSNQVVSCLLVTHYSRIFKYLKPDHVHVIADGRIVESGGAELATNLEKSGYAKYGII